MSILIALNAEPRSTPEHQGVAHTALASPAHDADARVAAISQNKDVRNHFLLSGIAAVLALLAGAMLMLAVFPSATQTALDAAGVGQAGREMSGYLNGAITPTAPVTGAIDRDDPARQEKSDDTEANRQIAAFLSKKYSVAPSVVRGYIKIAQRWAKEYKLDPWLVLGVMSIESNFNPIVESNMGAQGLMQILTRVHLDKLQPYGGEEKAFEAEANIAIGAKILADCVKLGGSVEAGLKCYVGATGPTDGGYGAKVLAERDRIGKASLGQFDFTPNNRVLLDLASSAASTPIKLEVSDSMKFTPSISSGPNNAVPLNAVPASTQHSTSSTLSPDLPQAPAKPKADGETKNE